MPDIWVMPGKLQFAVFRVSLIYQGDVIEVSNMWPALTFWALWRCNVDVTNESEVIKFARNVYWISAQWLNSFKASSEEYDAAFLMVSFFFFICTLSELFHILDQRKKMPLTRVMKVPTCMLYWQRRWKIGLVWILLFFAIILGAN